MAFRTPVLGLLLDLDTYGGVDPLVVIPPFLKRVENITAPKLSIIFRGLIHRGLFPEGWQSASVTTSPMGAPSPGRENYHPISITPILAKVYEKLLSHKLSSFRKKCISLPLLSLLTGMVWDALMRCGYISPSEVIGYRDGVILFSSTLVLPSIE